MIRPWSKGDSITAERLNAMVLEINAANRITSDGSLFISSGRTGHHLAVANRFRASDGIPIKNDNSSPLPEYSNVYVKSIDITQPSQPLIVVDKVGTAFKRDYLVTYGVPIAASGGIGLAQPGPIVTVTHDGATSPAIGDVFGPKESSLEVTKGQPALFTCLGEIDATNDWMLARMGEINSLLVKTTSAVAACTASTIASTTAYNIYVGALSAPTVSGFSSTPKPTAYNLREKIATDMWCELRWVNNDWRIEQILHKATHVRFALPSALTTSDASKSGCTTDDFWGGITPGSTVTVHNLPASSGFMFEGASGAKGLATYDEEDDRYWIVQLQCPA